MSARRNLGTEQARTAEWGKDMNRFKNILAVCSDTIGCDDVIEQASALALINQAKLKLIAFESATLSWREEQHKRLRRYASAVETPGALEVETQLVNGPPSMSIVREVIENRHDLVIISRDFGDTWSNALFGGTARKMMQRCPCPVWFLSPGQQVPFKNVLAVVDPCLEGDGGRDLNVKILEMATSLATGHDAVLNIVHAWEVDGHDYDTITSEMQPDHRQRLIEEHAGKRHSAISDLLDTVKSDDLDFEIHLPRDTPLRAYRSIASDLSIDVVVIAADDMSNLSFLLGGSLAETLMTSVSCSLLAVTPDDFTKSRIHGDYAAADQGRKVAM